MGHDHVEKENDSIMSTVTYHGYQVIRFLQYRNIVVRFFFFMVARLILLLWHYFFYAVQEGR